MKIVTFEALRQFKSLMMAYINRPDLNDNEWIRIIYPIGSIYMSTSEVSPEQLFGFERWEQIKDTFLLAAGDTYQAGSTGGSATHILTEEELATHHHHHTPAMLTAAEATTNGFTVGQATNKEYVRIASIEDSEEAGGGQAHNNMPPYLTVYTWRRVE